MSLTPRNAWEDADSTIVIRVNETFGLWAKQVAKRNMFLLLISMKLRHANLRHSEKKR